MAHPYGKDAHSSRKAKAHSMGHLNNLDIPVMRGVGEDRRGGIHESSNTMQHKKQSADNGMKKGGKVKHHKAAPIMMPPPAAPPPDPAAMAAAGAGGPPPGGAPPPAPGMPGMKRGGRTNQQSKPVDAQAYPLHKHGSKSGLGRLEKNHMGKPPFKGIK